MEALGRIVRKLVKPQLLAMYTSAVLLVVGFSLSMTPQISPRTASIVQSNGSSKNFQGTSLLAGAHVDCAKQACVALTFDDGPNPIVTPQILDALEAAHASATFFVIGLRAHSFPSILQRMNRDGYEIGNHSWSHPDLTLLSSTQIKDQINRTQAAVLAAGLPAPTLFRPPYGAINDTVCANIPMAVAMWNNDPEDWMHTSDPTAIYTSVIQQLKPGRVVDLHDIDQSTATALPQILKAIQDKHYQLVTFSQMFNLSSNATGEYFGR